ncbi:MAG: MbnP family protein [Bacteroidota bacterium]
MHYLKIISKWFLLPIIILVGFSGCKKSEDSNPAIPSGELVFSVEHAVDGSPLKRNEMIYTNAAGNNYLVAGLKYFISDITLYRDDGTQKMISELKDIFYIDEDIPATKELKFIDKIPAGNYDSISFIFGIAEAKNKSYRYVNPPEALMGWPEILGGGYHYMMLDGKWKNLSGEILPFNFHLGIGQLYKGGGYNVDSIFAYVQNYFRVSLPGSGFTMKDQETVAFSLTMNIENWFRNPHIYDHNYWGGAIMQNQPAMQMAKENGWNVFSVEMIPQNR